MDDTSDEIKAGDVVQLKSGGPPMTAVEDVTTVGESRNVWRCFWFDGGVMLEEDIPEACLRRVDAAPPPAPASAEPDAWQAANSVLANGPGTDREEPPLPTGFVAAGPWKPVAPTERGGMWRRPLRKVAP